MLPKIRHCRVYIAFQLTVYWNTNSFSYIHIHMYRQMSIRIGNRFCRSANTKIQCSCNLTHFQSEQILPHTQTNTLIHMHTTKMHKRGNFVQTKTWKKNAAVPSLLSALPAVVFVFFFRSCSQFLAWYILSFVYIRLKDLTLFTREVNDLIHKEQTAKTTLAGTNLYKVLLGYVCDSRLCRIRGQGQELPM